MPNITEKIQDAIENSKLNTIDTEKEEKDKKVAELNRAKNQDEWSKGFSERETLHNITGVKRNKSDTFHHYVQEGEKMAADAYLMSAILGASKKLENFKSASESYSRLKNAPDIELFKDTANKITQDTDALNKNVNKLSKTSLELLKKAQGSGKQEDWEEYFRTAKELTESIKAAEHNAEVGAFVSKVNNRYDKGLEELYGKKADAGVKAAPALLLTVLSPFLHKTGSYHLGRSLADDVKGGFASAFRPLKDIYSYNATDWEALDNYFEYVDNNKDDLSPADLKTFLQAYSDYYSTDKKTEKMKAARAIGNLDSGAHLAEKYMGKEYYEYGDK